MSLLEVCGYSGCKTLMCAGYRRCWVDIWVYWLVMHAFQSDLGWDGMVFFFNYGWLTHHLYLLSDH